MQQVLQNLQGLGRTYGSEQAYTATFNDEGMVSPTSPLRASYAHIEPTLLGFLAGWMRIMRIPQMVHVLHQVVGKRSLLDCALSDLKIALAAIYGDTDTAFAASNIVFVGQQKRFRSANQPQWLTSMRGGQTEFTTGDPELRTAMTAILTSSVAMAHQKTRVLLDGHDGTQYCRDLVATLGYVTNAGLEGITSLLELHELADRATGVRLMDRDQLTNAGVPELITSLLQAELAPGIPVSTFAPLIKGFLPANDRQALAGSQTTEEKNTFTAWLAAYAEKLNRYSLLTAEQVPDWSSTELSELHFFAVAARQAE